MAEPAKGSAIRRTKKIARILGTKTRVISWIWVSACSRPMATPTTSAVSMPGAASIRRTQMDSRAKSMVSAPVISFFRLDRHFHDVLVGGDHAVADGHHRFESELGRGDSVDDADEIALPGRALRGGGFTGAHRADGGVQRIGERLLEGGRADPADGGDAGLIAGRSD